MGLISYDTHETFIEALGVYFALEDDLWHDSIAPDERVRVDASDLFTKIIERECQGVTSRTQQDLKVVQLGPALLWQACN